MACGNNLQEAGIVLPEFGGGRAGSFIFSPTLRTEMFVPGRGCRMAGPGLGKLNEPKCTKQATQAVGGADADGVKQIDSYRYCDSCAAANTEWYTFLMLISARQMSEVAPARKLEDEQKKGASHRSANRDATYKTKDGNFPIVVMSRNVKQTRSNLT